ncbi:MAG: biotin/lipoyl-binding protein, partial [Dehalococcoidales bacterium]|nr:biotin/lipoyl-binding protein [Dehalococcoidales bacterium]
MKLKQILTAVLLAGLLAGVTACSNPFSAKPETNQQYEATQGDLTVKVNGNGKTGVATDAKLSFETGGKIEKLNVKKGDVVTKGDILAILETDDLELAKSQAQVALAQAQVTITQTKLAQQTAELALVKTRDTRSALELALFNAQVNRKTAEVALSRTEETAPAPDIVAAKAA